MAQRRGSADRCRGLWAPRYDRPSRID